MQEEEKTSSGKAAFSVAVIGHAESEFPAKFGIPRQSGLVPQLKARVVFHPPYDNPDAVRGLEEFSHLWLIWQFSGVAGLGWSPMVRPPRLGGNVRMGVFATRSPFRPNPIGLSLVKLEEIQSSPGGGAVLLVSGGDLMDGTPILDIKPYLPYADVRSDAQAGFAARTEQRLLQVEIPPECLEKIPPDRRAALTGVLAQDPRPAYQDDPRRVYGMGFAGLEVKFTVEGERLTVCRVEGKERVDG